MLVEMATVLTSLALATVGGPMLVALSFGCDNSIGIQGSTDKGYAMVEAETMVGGAGTLHNAL